MNRAKLVMICLTLTGIVVFALVAISAKNVLAAAQEIIMPTAELANDPDPEQLAIASQVQTEQTLAEMQSQEQLYQDDLAAANAQIEQLNAVLAELQLEGQEQQAAATTAQNQLIYAQNRAAQLRDGVTAMQARESQWITEIDKANQNVVELQTYLDQYKAQLAAAAAGGGGDNSGSSGGGHYDDDDDERDEDHGDKGNSDDDD